MGHGSVRLWGQDDMGVGSRSKDIRVGSFMSRGWVDHGIKTFGSCHRAKSSGSVMDHGSRFGSTIGSRPPGRVMGSRHPGRVTESRLSGRVIPG